MLFLKTKAKLRRAAAIHAYVGVNGSGKSLAMVNDTLRSLDAGRRVFSTAEVYDDQGEPHPLWVPLTSGAQLVDGDLEHADVLLDEVTGAVNARQSMGLPVQVQNLLVQLRRRDVVLRWTSPNFARADRILREVTQAVTVCRGHVPEPMQECSPCKALVPAKVSSCPTCGGRDLKTPLWPPRRLFLWLTYDSRDYEDMSAGKLERLRPIAREVFWRPGSRAERSYNTLAPVLTLDHLTEAGICVNCGGKRSHRPCKCPRHDEPIRDQGDVVEQAAAVVQHVRSDLEPFSLDT